MRWTSSRQPKSTNSPAHLAPVLPVFLFRVACSSAALLALLVAAASIEEERPEPVRTVMRQAAMDTAAPSMILQPVPDCGSVWRPPYPFTPAP